MNATTNNHSSYPTMITDDQFDLVLSLLLRTSLDNYSIIDSHRIHGIIKDTHRLLNGELWMTFDKFGNIIFYEGDIQSSPTTVSHTQSDAEPGITRCPTCGALPGWHHSSKPKVNEDEA